jgi:hypothetical protein
MMAELWAGAYVVQIIVAAARRLCCAFHRLPCSSVPPACTWASTSGSHLGWCRLSLLQTKLLLLAKLHLHLLMLEECLGL